MDSDDTNRYFDGMAEKYGCVVPHHFAECSNVYYSEIIENMMVILEAMIDNKIEAKTEIRA